MNYPKLKHPRLCRILTYVVVFGCGLLPIFVVYAFPVPDVARVIVMLVSLIGLLIFLFRNLTILMFMDIALASFSCYQSARKKYTLPSGRSADTIRRSILRYGRQCAPAPIMPQPTALLYQFSHPMTVYSRGIERVVAAYEVDMLNSDTYREIISSAKTNSKALIGRKKALFLDKEQKKNSLHRVTVILILAQKVDPQMAGNLYTLVCRQCGDEFKDCVIPCVVDLARRTCVFNCVRVPYIGYGYPVKNRGIRIIRQRVFGGNLNLRDNDHFLEPIDDFNPDDSLWDFWRKLHHQFIGAEKEAKRHFEAMSDREIRTADGFLYVRWDQHGICQAVEQDTENRTAKIESVKKWAYPKAQPIGKKRIQEIEEHIAAYYAKMGYVVEFADIEIK
ncbi:MAG: hypothetical protein ACI3VZ_04325 [Faecousia sp.]